MVLKPDNFTEQAREVLAKSQEVMRRYRHGQWDVEHMLLAVLGVCPRNNILTDMRH